MRYGVAVAAAVAAVLVRYALTPVLGSEPTFLVAYPAVVVAAWAGGMGPGVLAAALCMLGTSLLMRHAWGVDWTAAAALRFGLFGLSGLLIATLCSSLRSSQRRAESALAEARDVEQALRLSEARFRAVFNSEIAPMAFWDAAGRITEANDAFLRLIGYARADVEAGRLRWETFDPPHQSEADHAAIRQAMERGFCDPYEKEFVRHDGSAVPVLVSASILTDVGDVRGVGFAIDLSARKRAEEELRRAKDEAERANRAKDQFIAVLSHELRTPLTPVLAAAQMLEAGAASPALVAELAGVIRRNVELEVRLIDDLLDVSRAARGKMHVEVTTVDAHERIREVVRGCDGELHAKDLRVALDLDATRHHVRADPARFQQVLWNLLKNAAKFSHRGGRIAVRTRDAADGSTFELDVVDEGVGIDAGVLPRLFNPFEQGGPDVTRRFGGLGLGLAVSKQLLLAQGGTIEAHSDGSGTGATVRVRLRLAAADADAPAAAPPPPEGDGRHVLVVDDHADTTRVMSLLLRASGYRVRVAGSVAEAVEAAGRDAFDAVISDIGLPDGTGYDLMRLLTARRKIRGIAVTGYGTEDDIQLARDAGFEEHLTKPVNAGRLLEVLGNVVGATGNGGTAKSDGNAQAASTAT